MERPRRPGRAPGHASAGARAWDDRRVLFAKWSWEGIDDGSITVTFRRWKRQQALPGRTYRTPAMGLIATVGFLACLAAFLLGFVPPSGFAQGAPGWAYPVLVGVVVVLLGVPPLIFYAARRPGWDQRTDQEKATFDDVLVNPPGRAPEKGPDTA